MLNAKAERNEQLYWNKSPSSGPGGFLDYAFLGKEDVFSQQWGSLISNLLSHPFPIQLPDISVWMCVMTLSFNCLNPFNESSLLSGQSLSPLESCDWCHPPWSLPRRPVTLTHHSELPLSIPLRGSGLVQGSASMALGPNPTWHLFSYGLQAKN